MIRYRTVYEKFSVLDDSATEADNGSGGMGPGDSNRWTGTWIRVEQLLNGVPLRPPVGFTKREPTFLIRSTESGQWYAGYMQGLTDIHNAYEYTSAEILDKHSGWLWGVEIIRTDEALERYAGGL
jgi:hypothetical protein